MECVNAACMSILARFKVTITFFSNSVLFCLCLFSNVLVKNQYSRRYELVKAADVGSKVTAGIS